MSKKKMLDVLVMFRNELVQFKGKCVLKDEILRNWMKYMENKMS